MANAGQQNNMPPDNADISYTLLSGKSSDSSACLGDALVQIAVGAADLVIVAEVPGDLLQALSMRALAWYIDHQCLNTTDAKVIFVTGKAHLQDLKGSQHPALVLPVVRELGDGLEALDNQVRDESDFAAYMSHSGQYYKERLYTANWRVWLLRVCVCGIVSNILITVVQLVYSVSRSAN
ncbi:hypothetical protein C8Q76DRAFT_689626 [Earliella scabrosa]|nr:hypothetical protein C8Q76DRAFT_689626 [Earliella scabrosa]